MVNTVAAPFDRTALPIPETEYPPITEIDARKATPPPRFDVKAPPGAPNVMVVLVDNWVRRYQTLRRSHQHADTRTPRRGWIDLQQLSGGTGMLTESGGAAHRPQFPQREHGCALGDG
jgi:hypothetical protein